MAATAAGQCRPPPSANAIAEDYIQRYTAGDSIRTIVNATGRSYCFVRRVLMNSAESS